MSLLPVNAYRAAQVRELDRRAIENSGISGLTLMQRASAAALRELRWRWPGAMQLAVVCGPGNNGGDGLLLAVQAKAAGLEPRVMMLGDAAKLKGDAARAFSELTQAGLSAQAFDGSVLDQADVIVDALLGTGLARPVEGEYYDAIHAINAAHAKGKQVLALDVPSGLDADRGVPLGVAVEADVTVCFIGLKLGLLTGSGPQHAGRLVFAGLDVEQAVHDGMLPAALRVTQEQRRPFLPARRRDAHKGDHGHVLLVGGDLGMSGAIHLAGEACLRAGAGWASVATRAAHAGLITQSRPELMCHGVEQLSDLTALLARASVIALGPGLGKADWGRAMWKTLLASKLPLVLDADGLNLLSENPVQRNDWVLTPHPGEAARLLGCTGREIQNDRPAAVAAIAQRYSAVVVLKGAGTLIQAPGEPLYVCDAGNPGMATAGMGDILCGVIAAFLAQGMSCAVAARMGVLVHALAGDAAAQAGERGLLPSDMLPHIRILANP